MIKSLGNLFIHITKSNTASISLLAILFLPGVIIHELSHMLFAGVMQVPVGEISFTPEIREDDVRLGRVMIGSTDPIRRALIGFAPVIMGISIISVTFFYFTRFDFFGNIFLDLAFFFVLFEIGNTMFSSPKDLEGTVEIIIPLIFIFAGLFIVGLREPFYAVANFLNSNSESIKNLPIFLTPAIMIDGALCVVLNIKKIF